MLAQLEREDIPGPLPTPESWGPWPKQGTAYVAQAGGMVIP